ncbi:MAG: nucleotidyltransferase domain-containing protein [Candidatus Ranarchaeia archaeon]
MQLQKIEPPIITESVIEDIVAKITQHFHPHKIILFGSRVWGKTKEWSDIDLLVIMEYAGYSSQIAAEISIIAKPRYVPIDILVRTPREIEDRLRKGDYFIKRIIDKGKILYEETTS